MAKQNVYTENEILFSFIKEGGWAWWPTPISPAIQEVEEKDLSPRPRPVEKTN
jgi:hypothetical protein